MDYLNFENEYRSYQMMQPNMMMQNNIQQMMQPSMQINDTPYPLELTNMSTQYTLTALSNGLKEGVMDEKHDELFYEKMITLAPETDKKIIRGIAEDERIHNKIFRKAYYMLTGIMLPINTDENVKIDESNMTYIDMLKNSLMGELYAIKMYRKLLAFSPNKTISDMINYPLFDEIRHANLYNYLICQNMHKNS